MQLSITVIPASFQSSRSQEQQQLMNLLCPRRFQLFQKLFLSLMILLHFFRVPQFLYSLFPIHSAKSKFPTWLRLFFRLGKVLKLLIRPKINFGIFILLSRFQLFVYTYFLSINLQSSPLLLQSEWESKKSSVIARDKAFWYSMETKAWHRPRVKHLMFQGTGTSKTVNTYLRQFIFRV